MNRRQLLSLPDILPHLMRSLTNIYSINGDKTLLNAYLVFYGATLWYRRCCAPYPSRPRSSRHGYVDFIVSKLTVPAKLDPEHRGIGQCARPSMPEPLGKPWCQPPDTPLIKFKLKYLITYARSRSATAGHCVCSSTPEAPSSRRDLRKIGDHAVSADGGSPPPPRAQSSKRHLVEHVPRVADTLEQGPCPAAYLRPSGQGPSQQPACD